MIPVLFCLPLAGIISGVLTEKKKVPPIFTLLVASLLQILGLALMTTISVTDKNFPTAHYGYEVLMGLGFGLSLSTLIMSVPLVSEQRDRGSSTLFPFEGHCSRSSSNNNGSDSSVPHSRGLGGRLDMHERPQ